MNITNKDYETALRDINNIRIINKVKKKYCKYIPADDLDNCLLIALWKTLEQYDEAKGRKFTSYLYLHSQWECNNWITKDKKDSKYRQYQQLEVNMSFKEEEYDEFEDMISILPRKLAKVVKQKILHNMTFKEIAKKNKYSHETARKRFLEGIGVLSAGTVYSK